MNPKTQRILHKLLCLCAIFTMASCTDKCKDKEELLNSFSYDVQVPAPILEIADVYAEYVDEKGELHTELLPDGKFRKNFTFIWEGKDVYKSYWGISNVKITAKLKVDPADLQEGVMLMNDPDAHYNLNMAIKYKSENGVSSTPINLPLNLSVPDNIKNASYTVDEQMSFFEEQESSPLYSVTISRITIDRYDIEVHLNLGKWSESETENEGLQIKKRINAFSRDGNP